MAEAEALQRKKRVRAGHRASATQTQGQVGATLGDASPDFDKLSMLKLTLEEKLKTLKELDAEIVGLVAEDDLETEIQQADECQEKNLLSSCANQPCPDSCHSRPTPDNSRSTSYNCPSPNWG